MTTPTHKLVYFEKMAAVDEDELSEGPKRAVNPVHSALESNGVKEESWYQNRVLLNLTRINGVPLE